MEVYTLASTYQDAKTYTAELVKHWENRDFR